jgi:hypothetical protein
MSQMAELEDAFVFREDAALKAHLQGITVADLKSPERPVKVWFGYPDIEIRTQEYPYLVIEMYDIQPATDRQSSGFWMDDTMRGTVSAVEGETYSYYAPVTYDIFYQVSSYSRHPRHDRAIMFKMLNEKVPGKYGHLIVPDANGSGKAVARHMFLEGFVKQDTVEDGRRLFRNVFSIRVVSEMTFAQAAQAVPQVEQVNIQTLGNIPSGYQPI